MAVTIRPFRRLGLALATLQLLVYALVPLAHARPERSADVAVERAHSSQCLTLHAPDRCVLCQWAGQRARPVTPSAAAVPAAGCATPVVRSSPQTPKSHTTLLHASRAPPAAA